MKLISSIFATAAALAITVSAFAAPASSGNEGASPKALQSFESHFRGASDVSWYTVGKNRAEAKFILNSAKETAYFDAQGDLLTIFRSIDVANLPMEINLEMASQFPESAVRYATEINTNGSTVYILTLESTHDWKTVSVRSNNEVTVIKDLQKTFIQ